MDFYSLQRVARIEHEQMVSSVPTVYDADDQFPQEPSRRSSRLLADLRAFGARLEAVRRNQPHPTRPTLTLSNPSVFLRDQLRQDSNYEIDWLWAASQVAAEEIRYCLERALYINPNNMDTQTVLSKIAAYRAAAAETQPITGQGFAQASDHWQDALLRRDPALVSAKV